jgi:hypothetical protein
LRRQRFQFHDRISFACASTAASVRSTSFTLNALSMGGFGALQQSVRGGFRAARQRALGALHAPGLVCNAPQRHAPGAVVLLDQRDGHQRECIRRSIAHLVVELGAAYGLGQRDRGDQLARLQGGFDLR